MFGGAEGERGRREEKEGKCSERKEGGKWREGMELVGDGEGRWGEREGRGSGREGKGAARACEGRSG